MYCGGIGVEQLYGVEVPIWALVLVDLCCGRKLLYDFLWGGHKELVHLLERHGRSWEARAGAGRLECSGRDEWRGGEWAGNPASSRERVE